MKKTPLIVGIGEVLWDIFPDATHFGGAPANLVCHAAALGVEAILVSSTGADDLGKQAVSVLKQKGISTDWIQLAPDHPTGAVNVALDEKGQASYQFQADSAWDHLKWNHELVSLAVRCGAVVFGSLAQRSPESAETILRFVNATSSTALRVFDVNLRQAYYSKRGIEESLNVANVLKLNSEELLILQQLLGLKQSSERALLTELSRRFALHTIALTRGENGSLLLINETFTEVLLPSTNVVDTVGAGDAFTAALIVGLLANAVQTEIHFQASAIASYVCSQSGATPELPAELAHSFSQIPKLPGITQNTE